MFGSIRVAKGGSFWRKLAAFLGPGYLVAVGYMDPGNWATSLAGGSKFGYALLAVALISNIMAIVLQALCARLGVGSGRDLAQACRDAYPKWVSWPLWLLAEIAISATDLAEIIGTAIGLNLLFGIPLEIGVLITAADVFLILALQAIGFRWIEAFVVALLGVIAACFAVQIAMADPDWGGVIRGFAPTVEIVRNPEMLYLALGILGATVMPHNLYLHSGLVQTRGYGDTVPEKRKRSHSRPSIPPSRCALRCSSMRRSSFSPPRHSTRRVRSTLPSSIRRTRCWRRCSALRLRQRFSA
jgi:manganese transport protein